MHSLLVNSEWKVGAGDTATIPKGANLSSSSPFKGGEAGIRDACVAPPQPAGYAKPAVVRVAVRRGMGPEVAEFPQPPPPAQGSSFPVTGPASVASVAERLSRQ